MRFEELLRNTANKSTSMNYQLGALLMKGGSVINFGFSHDGTCAMIERRRHMRPKNDSVHAEIHAILGIAKSVAHKCTLYVGRFTAAGEPANAKPCMLCQSILKEMGVRRVYYTAAGCGDYLVLVL